MSQLTLEQQEALARVIANLNQSVAAIQSGAGVEGGVGAGVGTSFVPVTSAAYTERLEKALLKNFDFIRRKDAGLLKPSEKAAPSSSSGSGGSGYQANGGHGFRQPAAGATQVVYRPGIGAPGGDGLPLQPAMTSSAAAARVPPPPPPPPPRPPTVEPSTSVYVSGLPKDITQEDIDILFSSQGSIKKIKLYVGPDGKKKGDALVTYHRADAVNMACIQYNNLNIGEGCIISVTKAEFSTAPKIIDEKKDNGSNSIQGVQGFTNTNDEISGMRNDANIINISNIPIVNTTNTTSNTTTTISTNNNNITTHNNQSISNNRSNISMALPPECLVKTHPVVLISNVYNPMDSQCQLDPNFFMDLEAEMLIECVKYGKIVCLMTPEGPQFDHRGCIAVTYETIESARLCAGTLHGRLFDGKPIETLVFSSSGMTIEDGSYHQITKSSEEAAATDEGEPAEDVDDFLNSLL